MRVSDTLTTVEAVQQYGISPAYLYALLRFGRLAGATQIDRRGTWSIPRQSLDNYFANRRRAKSV